MKSKHLPTTVGNLLEIPLAGKRKGYAWFVYRSKSRGDLIQVFNIIVPTDRFIAPDEIIKKGQMFPPVATSVTAAVNHHGWKKIYFRKVIGLKFPDFVSTFYDEKDGTARVWFLIREHEDVKIGDTLPEKYHDLEFFAHLSPDLVAKRIVSGKKPYDSLIRTNILTEDPTKI